MAWTRPSEVAASKTEKWNMPPALANNEPSGATASIGKNPNEVKKASRLGQRTIQLEIRMSANRIRKRPNDLKSKVK
jgi:hypothetical protein